MAKKRQNQANNVNTTVFVDSCNKAYQKNLIKKLDPIRVKIEEWVREEAKNVYIAGSYRIANRMAQTPRFFEDNEFLAAGVVSSPVKKINNMLTFIVTNIASPKEPLFKGERGKAGDLSMWTIGESTYDGSYSDDGKSFIHPLINGGRNLDMSTFYEGDPYIERAIKIHWQEIVTMINEAMSESIREAVMSTIKKYNLSK